VTTSPRLKQPLGSAGSAERGLRDAAEPTRRDAMARRTEKSPSAFRTISEVADELNVPQHVLRFWETKFPQVRPLKRGGGRRYYRPEDVELLRSICALLYREGYTIKGVQRLLREGALRDRPAAGAAAVIEEEAPPPPAKPAASQPRATGASSGRSELHALIEELSGLRDRLRRFIEE
jgi:DNA-binding transcriptional MerR regulator